VEFAENGQCRDRQVSHSDDIWCRLHEQVRQGQPIRLEDFEKLRNEVEGNRSRSSFNESLCDDQSFDFSRGAVSPISDDDNKSNQHLSSQIMSTEQSPEYQSEMEDSQYFLSQEYNDRNNHFKSEKRRDEVRPTDRMKQTVATGQMQSKAKDSSRHDSGKHWGIETGIQSEAEVHMKSVETRDSRKSDWEINMEERLHRLRRNPQTTTATSNEAADQPMTISSTRSDSLEHIPESTELSDQVAEDDFLYSSQCCKHDPGYQYLSDNHADESNEDSISYSCSDHRLQQHTLCGRRRKVEYGTNSNEVSPAKQRNQGALQRNANLNKVNDGDEGILLQQRIPFQTRMMSINKHRRDLNECQSEEEPDSADHLSPRMFESPKARSDDQILRRRHCSTEADHRRPIEFERQDFGEEIRHWSNLRQQSQEQTRRDDVTMRSPTPARNGIDGRPSASQENGTHDEYSGDQSQHSEQDVRSTSRSSSLLQLPELFQSAHRTGHLVTDLQEVEKPRSLNFIDENSRYNRLNEGVIRSIGDQRERTTVTQEQRSWSTVDTDIHVQRDNVEVVRPSSLSEP